jgi:polyhydroxybutyrate depolymerase
MLFRKLFFCVLLIIAFAVSVQAQEATPEPTPDPLATLESQGTEEAFTGFTPGGYTITVEHDDLPRAASLYLPPSYTPGSTLPLLLIFHGAGGDPRYIADMSWFNALADQEGFIALYPNSAVGVFNDGRSDPMLATINDVGFVDTLLDFLSMNGLTYDADRVYATGYSAGGMFSFRLACHLRHRIAAIASVAGLMPEYTVGLCNQAVPLPVMFVQGTEDQVIQWSGVMADGLGYLSTYNSLLFWSLHNGCDAAAVPIAEPDAVADDGTLLIRTTYTNCDQNASVVLLGVYGGGHTWPGHPIQASIQLGATSLEFDASAEIWAFLSQYSNAGIEFPPLPTAAPEPTAEPTAGS